jgi:hypothetical protein
VYDDHHLIDALKKASQAQVAESVVGRQESRELVIDIFDRENPLHSAIHLRASSICFESK